jgi:hypothetical protein
VLDVQDWEIKIITGTLLREFFQSQPSRRRRVDDNVIESTRLDNRNPETSGCHRDGMPRIGLLRSEQDGIRLLLEAYLCAEELDCDVWDFAVEIESLEKDGVTRSRLRWLVCKGYVDHAIECTLPGEPKRAFRHLQGPCGLAFSRRTCFVLTANGVAFAKSVVDDRLFSPCTRKHTVEPVHPAAATIDRKPEWDSQRQELRIGDAVVKQFKVPAANQERILAAFEEEGWPVRIDDPLPPNSEQNPKRRLHDTINSLNRNQKLNLLRFTGDGSGQGVRWELVVEDIVERR